jgi:hypothetical protein
MNTSCNCKDILQNYEEEKKNSFFSGRIKKIPDQLLYIQLGAALGYIVEDVQNTR